VARAKTELERQVQERLGELEAQTAFDWTQYFDPLLTEVSTLLEASDPTPQAPFRTHRVRGARYVRRAKELVAAATRPVNRFILQRQAEINDRSLVLIAGLLRRLAWLGERWRKQEEEIQSLRRELTALTKRLAALERPAPRKRRPGRGQ
jgi:uncharacterized coiled-coil protein SlyX